MSRRMSEAEYRLRMTFLRNATDHPKKHGHWAIFKFPLENTFLSMDAHNGDLRYAIGGGGYEYWTGFNGKTFIRFGGNNAWGVPGKAQPDNVIEFYIKKIEAEVERRGAAG